MEKHILKNHKESWLKLKDGEIWIEIYKPIERTEEDIKAYFEAVEYLAKTKSELVFDTKDYELERTFKYTGSIDDLLDKFNVKTEQDLHQVIGKGIRI